MTGFWNGRRVLVTGAGGFVGAWLACALVERGARVVALLFERGAGSTLPLLGCADDIVGVGGDLRDLQLLRRILDEHEIEAVFHLAAQALVGPANQAPLDTFESNILGTWNLLEACRGAKRVERIVVASSDKAYGDQPVLPYTEDLPLNGLHPYDASKACTDILARCYGHTYELPVAVTRMANIYGPADLNYSRIIPGTIRSLLLGERPIIRSDGTPVRDYLYAADAVDAYLRLAERLPSREAATAFNFGTNQPISVLALVEVIAARMGTADVEPEILSPGKIRGEIDRQYLDSSAANRILGWTAQTPLADGIDATVDWYRRHPESLAAHAEPQRVA